MDDEAEIVTQKCGIGGCCPACIIGAASQIRQISVVTAAPPRHMGELPVAPPIIDQQGMLYLGQLAAGQQEDGVISWFIENVMQPLAKRDYMKFPTADMHKEAKAMFAHYTQYKMSLELYYGTDKALVYRNRRVVVPPALRMDLIYTAHTVGGPRGTCGHPRDPAEILPLAGN